MDAVESLIVDLLEWIGPDGRSYRDVMDAWRTSCPRLPVWEEANARGFIEQTHRRGQEAQVSVTPAGRAHLQSLRRTSAFHS
jgi:hypothetical protein